MRELIYYVAVSLDGKIAAPDHTFAEFVFEGDHAEVIKRDYAETLPTQALTALGLTAGSRFDTVLMGWNTYAVGLPVGVDSPYSHLRQFVFSRSRDADAVAADVTLTDEDPVKVVQRLKSEETGSGIWLCGGGQLASALAGEIDRLILKINPVVFGAGIPLFAEASYSPRPFRLVASTPFRSGVTINEYARG